MAELSRLPKPLRQIDGNEETFKALIGYLRNGVQIIPFVGAGLSQPFGFPTWSQFLRIAAKDASCNKAVERHLRNSRYEEAAEAVIRKLSKSEFQRLVHKYFAPTQKLRSAACTAIGVLRKLDCNLLVTTNFDSVIETVYERAGVSLDAIIGARPGHMFDNLLRRQPSVLKLHGDARDSKDLILTKQHYLKHYGAENPLRIQMKEKLPLLLSFLLQGHVFLFLGCSLNADRTTRIISYIAKKYDWVRHYAVLPQLDESYRQEERKKQIRSFGIQPIWYPGDDHGWVTKILSSLSLAIERQRSSSSAKRPMRSGTRANRLVNCVHDYTARATSNGEWVTVFCPPEDYAEMAIDLAKHADEFLFWSVNGSPLRIPPEFENSKTTLWEKAFAKVRCREGKIRLVVFESFTQWREYMRARRVGNARHDRRKAFEQSATALGGKLLFTAQKVLEKKMYFAGRALDIGFIVRGRAVRSGVGFHSPQEAGGWKKGRTHVTFFSMRGSCSAEVLRTSTYRALYADVPRALKLIEAIRDSNRQMGLIRSQVVFAEPGKIPREIWK